jgi:hypothetical protein
MVPQGTNFPLPQPGRFRFVEELGNLDPRNRKSLPLRAGFRYTQVHNNNNNNNNNKCKKEADMCGEAIYI